jgi:5-methyltetrahydrofolate--homocysteine methyltransferase
LLALAKEAGSAYVAGDMTTTGIPLEPLGTMKYHTLFETYAEQAAALREGGADLIVIETMLGLEETTVALEAVQSVCDLPVMCSLTVQTDGRLYFGGSILEAAPTLQATGASAVGINCSLGPEQLVSLVRNLREAVEIPLLIKPNAGMPLITEQGEAVYPLAPEEFAHAMEPLLEAGATFIGGCCGTDPRYIAQLRRIL